MEYVAFARRAAAEEGFIEQIERQVSKTWEIDLAAAVAEVKTNPSTKGGMAPVYGMAAAMPMHGVVEDMLKRVVDALYRVG